MVLTFFWSSLFFIGFLGVFITRKNLLLVFMSIELMLAAISFSFILNSIYLDDILGQVIALSIIALGAAEVAIGLAILIVYFRLKNCIAIEYISTLKGRSLD